MSIAPIISSFAVGYFISEYNNAQKNLQKQENEKQQQLKAEKIQEDKIKQQLKEQQQLIQQQNVNQQVKSQNIDQIKEKKEEIQKETILSPIQIIDYSPYYKSYYDKAKKIPVAVEETLTKKTISGTANRKNSNFHAEPQVEPLYQSTLKDYFQFFNLLDLNRGHMSAASNHKFSQKGMDASFSLANIVPQNGDNNQDLWLTFESLSKLEAQNNDSIKVISGPIFLPEEMDKKELKKPQRTSKFAFYKAQNSDIKLGKLENYVIGENQVHVPTHLYKIFYIKNKDQKNKLACFLVPNSYNENIDIKIQNWQVPLEKIESLTGLKFSELREDMDNTIDYCQEENSKCQKTQRKLDYDYYSQILKKSNNIMDTAFIAGMMKNKKASIKDYDDLYDLYKEQFGNSSEICKNVAKDYPHWKTEKECDQFDCFTKLNATLGNTILKEENDLSKQYLKSTRQALKKCSKNDPDQKIEKLYKDMQKSWWNKQTIIGSNLDYVFKDYNFKNQEDQKIGQQQ